MDNRLILVVGPGRSGTSLGTGMLEALGARVPEPRVAADDSNPRGFYEPRWVVEFHTSLLRAVGVHVGDAQPSAWSRAAEIGRDDEPRRRLEKWLRREFRRADHVAVKDPRLLWFLPLWERAASPVAGTRYLTMLRHPAEVVTSQQRHYVRWDDNNRVAGWLNTMLFTERATRGSTRALVPYDDLLEDPPAVLQAVCARLDLALVERARLPNMQAVDRLVDPALRRSRATWESMEVDRRLVEMAEEAWDLLTKLAAAGAEPPAALSADLDHLRRSYVDLYGFAESLTQSTRWTAQRSTNLATRLANRWAPDQPPLTLRSALGKGLRWMRRRISSADRARGPAGQQR
jgi:hypothetical protein